MEHWSSLVLKGSCTAAVSLSTHMVQFSQVNLHGSHSASNLSTLYDIHCHENLIEHSSQTIKWLPWQPSLVAGYRQYLHSVSRPLKPLSITNRLVAIIHTKPVNSNFILVPKLVAMATSLRPSISAMSSLDSLSLKTHP